MLLHVLYLIGITAEAMTGALAAGRRRMDTFGVIMLALVNNEPKVLNIKDMLGHYLKHQEEVVTRRTKYELNKAEERAHILEGLLIALDHIEEVIQIIRNSENVMVAKERLMAKFNLMAQNKIGSICMLP